MKIVTVIIVALLTFAAIACSKRPELTQKNTTTTTTTSYEAPVPAPEVYEEKKSTTITVQ